MLSWIKFLSRVIELSFSTQLKCLNSTSQLNLTLFQKNFNSTQHFSSWVLDLNSSTQLDVINLCKMLKINIKLSIMYHSEIDDQIERINAVIKHYLWVFVNYMQNDWVKWLFEVKFIVNNASSLITLTSFFLINLSQNSCLNFKSFEFLLENFTS